MAKDKTAEFGTVETKATIKKALVSPEIQPEHIIGDTPKGEISHPKSARRIADVPKGE